MNLPPLQPRDDRPAGDRCEVTLRDHFAAAALTGLLAQGDDGSFSEESYVRAAYRWADAMLREPNKTAAEKTSGSCSVTLTDAEREAVGQAIDAANGMGQAEPWTMRTLRGLLERLK